MGKRRLSRELALQALYLIDVSLDLTPEEALRMVQSRAEGIDEKSEAFIRDLVEGTARHVQDLDARIQKTANNWEIARMAAVDRSLLRLAAYEMLHHADTPVRVIIDEAIEISKKYSSGESPRFINGILDKIQPENGSPADRQT